MPHISDYPLHIYIYQMSSNFKYRNSNTYVPLPLLDSLEETAPPRLLPALIALPNCLLCQCSHGDCTLDEVKEVCSYIMHIWNETTNTLVDIAVAYISNASKLGHVMYCVGKTLAHVKP